MDMETPDIDTTITQATLWASSEYSGLPLRFSWGIRWEGMTAALVASQVGDEISGVILADPTFLSLQRQHEVYESDVAEQHRRLLSMSKDDVLAETRARHPHRSSEIVERLVEARLQTRLNAFEVLKPPNPEYRQLVSAIRAPILLILGDVGSVVSLETASELQSLNPRVRVEQIQGAGHGVPYDQPERFEAVVRHFLRSVNGLLL